MSVEANYCPSCGSENINKGSEIKGEHFLDESYISYSCKDCGILWKML